MSTSAIRVAIVGGGPGGLTLANILKKIGIPFTVFELDTSRNARSQGGMLDIHAHTGQQALVKAGLMSEFKKRILTQATEFYLRDHTGKVLMHQAPPPEEEPDMDRPEIDRTELRSMLLDALDKADIQWGQKVTQSEKVEDGTFKLHFANGTTAEGFNILVGADGVWSKIRALRSDVLPPYSGMNAVTTSISDIDQRFPHIAAFVGKGTLMMTSGRSMTVAQRNGHGIIKAYSCIPVEENWKETSGINWEDGKKAMEEFIARYHSDWSQEHKDLFIECDEGEQAVRPIYMIHPGHKLEKDLSGVTLLGDGLHVLSPFAGTGVNNAMYDAYELSVALEKIAFEGGNADALLAQYEKTSIARALEDGKECRKNQEMWLTGKSISEIVAQFEAMFAGGPPGSEA